VDGTNLALSPGATAHRQGPRWMIEPEEINQ
jgi:hypothetical protein